MHKTTKQVLGTHSDVTKQILRQHILVSIGWMTFWSSFFQDTIQNTSLIFPESIISTATAHARQLQETSLFISNILHFFIATHISWKKQKKSKYEQEYYQNPSGVLELRLNSPLILQRAQGLQTKTRQKLLLREDLGVWYRGKPKYSSQRCQMTGLESM